MHTWLNFVQRKLKANSRRSNNDDDDDDDDDDDALRDNSVKAYRKSVSKSKREHNMDGDEISIEFFEEGRYKCRDDSVPE
ncbi:hypothetical protein T4A_1654 [Trichinella pseudospiralis]|uniref:Uncharacterized protein n=1 Tax=Trichinella pseudospiralis TaxID=6337 RepID=A0A0V1F0T5_TRIPS|nr:hypothetical protein T4A_1654 [Trichinella pseudospiralis]